MAKRKWKYEWPKLTVEMPDTVIPQWLNYTIELLGVPVCGAHPDDIERDKQIVAACKTLLKYVT